MSVNSYLNRIRVGGLQPHELSTNGCLYPKVIKVFNSDNCQWYDMPVNCNNCIRCADDLRNDWASRMCLHSLAYKHCYYITLTYGTYNLHEFSRHPFKEDWLSTYPILTDYNYNNHKSWTPSILIRSHLQKYLKRLRKRCKSPISFAACGELGGTFCRPHFHLIIWSDDVITPQTFQAAWSYDVVVSKDKNVPGKKIAQRWTGSYSFTQSPTHPYPGGLKFNSDLKCLAPVFYTQDISKRQQFDIGHVDVDDLVADGALDWNSAYDRHNNSNSRNCFSYVAKYIGKRQQIPDEYKMRVANIWYKLPFADCSLDTAVVIEVHSFHFPEVIDVPVCGFRQDGAHYVPTTKYKKQVHYPIDYIVEDSPSPTSDAINIYRQITINGTHYEKLSLQDLTDLVSPFFVSSRNPAIGKLYLDSHLAEFQKGNYNLPKFQGRDLAFPRYYSRMVNASLYPVRFLKSGVLSSSLCKSELPRIHAYYSQLLECPDVFTLSQNPFQAKRLGITPDRLDSVHHGRLSDITLQFKDGEGFRNVTYRFNPHEDIFEGYVYDRKSRSMILHEIDTREDFCSFIIELIEKRWYKLSDRLQKLSDSLELYNLIKEDPLTPEYRAKYVALREEKQQQYKSFHKDIL